MMNRRLPKAPVKNDGIAIRIQGIRGLWHRGPYIMEPFQKAPVIKRRGHTPVICED